MDLGSLMSMMTADEAPDMSMVGARLCVDGRKVLDSWSSANGTIGGGAAPDEPRFDVTFDVTNTGARAGATVAQVYVSGTPDDRDEIVLA